MDGTYVQYGCGLCAPDGWLNFDASPTARAQRIPMIGSLLGRRLGPMFPASVRFGDIRTGLPIPDGSCAAVYCSHVLEHLALDDFRLALKNTLRILRPGGRFRLVMPDLRVLAEDYLAAASSFEGSMRFMRDSCLGQTKRPKGIFGAMREWIGNSQHRWMWDFLSVEKELSDVGFVSIRPAKIGDSGDPHFDLVENAGRWNKALAVDCKRPE